MRPSSLAMAWLLILVAIVAVRPRPTPGPLLRDFEAYWSAGAAWNARADPYGRAVWEAERGVPGVDARRDEILPFVNPPWTLAAWTLFARLPYDAAARVWAAILVASLGALGVAVLYATHVPVRPAAFLAAVGLAIGFGPITSGIALGQLALPAFLGAVLVVVAAARSLPVATAAACAAFAQPNVALGLIAQLGRRRVAVALLLGAAAAYAFGAAFAGTAWPISYARAVFTHGAAERFSAIQFTPASIAHGLGAVDVTAQLMGAGIAALSVIGAVLLARRVNDPFERFAGCCALVPFVAGFFHEHDFVVAYPAALCCAIRARGTIRAVSLAGTLLVAVDWLGLSQRPSGILQSALLAAAAVAAFAALGNEMHLRRSIAVLLSFTTLFAAAAWLGAEHPAPVWPDALGAFRASAGESLAAVWAQEQVKAGLLGIAPAWSVLRSLPLLGSAILAYVIYRRSSYCRTA
jgi:hypothetical protein